MCLCNCENTVTLNKEAEVFSPRHWHLSGNIQDDCKANKLNLYIVSPKRNAKMLRFEAHTLMFVDKFQNRLQNFAHKSVT